MFQSEFSQSMKIHDKLSQRLVKSVFRALKEQNIVTFKDKEDAVIAKATAYIQAEFTREQQLDSEVQRMMDDLERQNPGSFERYKMFPMLKKRLAKEKGIIL